jgi:hypothetical protein
VHLLRTPGKLDVFARVPGGQVLVLIVNGHESQLDPKCLTYINDVMIVAFNPLVSIVIVDDATNNYEAFTLRTISSAEYNIILQITQIFSNVHKVG